MSEKNDTVRVINRWIEKAENDLITARHTLKLKKKCPFDTVCFHAQQCAEKYLKALLIKSSVEFPKTHDLLLLYELLPAGDVPEPDKKELRLLTQFAVESRYPDTFETLTREDAKNSLKTALKIRSIARSILSEEEFELS